MNSSLLLLLFLLAFIVISLTYSRITPLDEGVTSNVPRLDVTFLPISETLALPDATVVGILKYLFFFLIFFVYCSGLCSIFFF